MLKLAWWCVSTAQHKLFLARPVLLFLLFCFAKRRKKFDDYTQLMFMLQLMLMLLSIWIEKISRFFKKVFCGTKFGVNILSHLLSLFHIISLPSIPNASQGKNGEYSPRPRYRYQDQINKISNGILWSFKLMYQFWTEYWYLEHNVKKAPSDKHCVLEYNSDCRHKSEIELPLSSSQYYPWEAALACYYSIKMFVQRGSNI